MGKEGDVKLREAEAQGKSWFNRTGDNMGAASMSSPEGTLIPGLRSLRMLGWFWVLGTECSVISPLAGRKSNFEHYCVMGRLVHYYAVLP